MSKPALPRPQAVEASFLGAPEDGQLTTGSGFGERLRAAVPANGEKGGRRAPFRSTTPVFAVLSCS